MEERKPAVIKHSFYSRSLEDLQATALSINYNGNFLLLAGRRYLALQNLENYADPAFKKFHRNSKFEGKYLKRMFLDVCDVWERT